MLSINPKIKAKTNAKTLNLNRTEYTISDTHPRVVAIALNKMPALFD